MGWLASIKNLGKRFQADSLLRRNCWLFEQGYYQEAVEVGLEALKIYEELSGSVDKIAGVTFNLSWLYIRLGNYKNGLKYGKYSLQSYSSISDETGTLRACSYSGIAYHHLGDYKKALDYHQRSYKLAVELSDFEWETIALSNIGEAFLSLGKYMQAIEYISRSLARLENDTTKLGKSDYLRDLNLKGACYVAIGEYDTAEEYFRLSLLKARELPDIGSESHALTNLGMLLYRKGSYEEAIKIFNEGLKIKEKVLDLKGICIAVAAIGRCYKGLGKNDEALKYLQDSLEIARRMQRKESIWQALCEIAIIYLKSDNPEKAYPYAEEALKVIGAEAVSSDASVIYQLMSFVFIGRKDYPKAERFLRKSISIAENIRTNLGNESDFKISFFENQARYYHQLQAVLAAQGKFEEALEISERARARALVETLALKLKSQDIAEDLLSPPNINRIKEIARRQQVTLVVFSVVNDLQRAFSFEDRNRFEIFTWVISPDAEIKFHRTGILFPDKIIESFANPSPAQLSPPAFLREAAFDAKQNYVDEAGLLSLYKLLIEPIEKFLPADEESLVTFIPDPYLFLIPFAALTDENGKFLIEKHTLSSAPSIQTLELTHKQQQRVKKSGKRGIMIVGNPEMPEVNWNPEETALKLAPLEHAEREAIEIAGQFHTQPLIGALATKSSILSIITEQKIIHLATHGIFNELDKSRIPGDIALAASEDDNGLLTAEEISQLELNADLVVLSACNTAQGRIAADGIIGLFRAFMVAGVPSIIVSLWSIPDAPTAALMTYFYKDLDKSKNKAQALREAMLKTMKTHRAPSDWASFLLIGEAG